MDDSFSLTVETALLFFGILFLAFCCGFLRSLKRYFGKRGRPPRQRHRNILVTHIRIPTPVPLQTETNVASAFPGDEQINPPPYSAVSNILPPSYDEAIKQNAAGNEHENEPPKTEARF